MITIKIGKKEYKVREAKTEEELEKGLKGTEELPEDEGMLFYMQNELSQQVFTMKGMKIPLDIIFINQDQEVIDIQENCKPGQKFIVSSTENIDSENDFIQYVLEINPNSGIKVGDQLELEGEGPVMKVLAQDGSTQISLWGGERIFSRKNTFILINKAKKAEESKEEKDYKALGRYIFKCIKGQDERKPEFVDAPK